MGLLKTAFLISIFWCQIKTAPLTEKECPNEFSYILGDKCYSLHTELEFIYYDAVDYCKNHSGTLWSKPNEEEIEFLRKVHAKLRYEYWVGARKDEGRQWKYLSDNSQVSQSLLKKPQHKTDHCLALKYSENKLTPISCRHKLFTICEYTGAKCENEKNEGKECFEFTVTEEYFTDATKICESIGGRIAEVRVEDQLTKLNKAIKQDKDFENIREDKLNKFDSSFPILWQESDENVCQIYENRTIQITDCSGSRHFACEFDAIQKTPEITTLHSTEADLPGATPKKVTTIIVNALPTLPDDGFKEKTTIITDHDDTAKASTTIIIIMAITIVILIVAVAYLLYRVYWAGNGGY